MVDVLDPDLMMVQVGSVCSLVTCWVRTVAVEQLMMEHDGLH